MAEKKQPFIALPGGMDIALWWAELSPKKRRVQTADGTRLWRDGSEYCYLWVTAIVDHDMTEHYLLDVRTKRDGTWESRDFLWVQIGGKGTWCEWHNSPISFDASSDEHVEREYAGLCWFVDRAVDEEG